MTVLTGLAAKILLRRLYPAAKLRGSVPGPARIIDDSAGDRNEVGITGTHDLFGLLVPGDKADRDSGQPSCSLDCPRQWHLRR